MRTVAFFLCTLSVVSCVRVEEELWPPSVKLVINSNKLYQNLAAEHVEEVYQSEESGWQVEHETGPTWNKMRIKVAFCRGIH
eukprot:Skav234596  [mRNA]  locus=scaffold5214:67904:71700:- [translate_table: standard]